MAIVPIYYLLLTTYYLLTYPPVDGDGNRTYLLLTTYYLLLTTYLLTLPSTVMAIVVYVEH